MLVLLSSPKAHQTYLLSFSQTQTLGYQYICKSGSTCYRIVCVFHTTVCDLLMYMNKFVNRFINTIMLLLFLLFTFYSCYSLSHPHI